MDRGIVVTRTGAGRLAGDGVDEARARTTAARAAMAGCAGVLGYGWLKVAWGLGSTVGVRDVMAWNARISELAGWQWFLAMWGTVLLDVVAAAMFVALAASTVGSPTPASHRRLLRALAWLGVLLTGPVGVIGLASVFGPVVGFGSNDEGPLATWVFVLVYGSFCVIGVSFAVAARANARLDRKRRSTPPCDRCG